MNRGQVPMPVRFRTVLLDCGYRLDLLVEDLLISMSEYRKFILQPSLLCVSVPLW
jgi:hypothetical protein